MIHVVSGALGGGPVPDLPLVATVQEYIEQKATIVAIFALAFGLYSSINPVPHVIGP